MTSNLSKVMKKYTTSVQAPEEAGHVDRLLLDSPRLNYNFGGGFPLGRIVEFFGPESGGKSVLSWYIGGHIQRREKQNVVLILDYERTFNSKYARTAGLELDPDKLIIIRPLTGEEGFQIAQEMVETGDIGLIIIDSLAAIPAGKAVDSDYGKGFVGPAALISSALVKFNPYLDRFKTSLININQERDDIGGFSPVPGMVAKKTPGGAAPRYWASWRARVTRTQDIKVKGVAVGNGIKVTNKKNKIGVPKRVSEMVLYYGSGFDVMEEYVSFIADKEMGLADIRGAWIYGLDGTPLEGQKFQGRANLSEWLLQNPGVLEACKLHITAKFEQNLSTDVDPDEDIPGEEESPADWETFAAQPTGDSDD